MKKMFCMLAVLAVVSVPLRADSKYPVRLDDARAVYLTPDHFPVHADGVADDSDALQQAVNKVQETTTQGILFLPSGRYRITRTIYIWPSIRVIGYGKTRPVLLLGANTPGFQQGPSYMVFFAGSRPGTNHTSGDARSDGKSGPPMRTPAPSIRR